MDYFPRKSLSKYLITVTIDFNKHVHDIDIFINDKWRKYAGGDSSKLQVNFHKATSSPSIMSPVSISKYCSSERKRLLLDYSVSYFNYFNLKKFKQY
jgi:hypothetical protein